MMGNCEVSYRTYRTLKNLESFHFTTVICINGTVGTFTFCTGAKTKKKTKKRKEM